ncbi:MAG: flagellar FlbD family protein [Clostridia bacterium]|nr:flagellar FlbD family protein [Clostridia bacterium]MDH7573460.1 flagellar FlbD family protein [Clostridia bacterium]
MIKVITLDGREIILNAELIERVETVPETVITLVTGKKILVRDTVEEVVGKVMSYRRQVGSQPVPLAGCRDEVQA